MTTIEHQPKVFFGWWTVLVTGITSGLGIGFYFYGISALLKPIALELGLSRAAASGAAGMGTMVGSLLAPFLGLIVDKFGPKLAILVGVLITVVGLMLMGIVTSVLGFYLVWGLLLGIGVNLGLTIAIDKALANWFVKKIGLAMGSKFALIGLVGAMALPCVSWLVMKAGWRNTCLTWAAILLVGIPFVMAFVRNQKPEYYGMLPDGEKLLADPKIDPESAIILSGAYASGLPQGGFRLGQAIRTKAFWILAVSFSVQFFITAGFNTHCIPFLTEMKIDAVVAGGMMGIMLALTIPSRFISGLLADRVRKDRMKLLLALPFFLQAIGIGVFLISRTSFTLYALLILYGIAHGLPTPLFIITISRYFGREAFASIFGTSFLFAAPVTLFSPVFTGWLFDTTGSYVIALILFALLSLFATFLLSSLKAPTDDP
jgi:cyanate permease